MPVVGLDDTDSRETGMCTTYVAAVLGERLGDAGYDVHRHLLVRCNPAVEHKTRGNAALALHVEAPGMGDGRTVDATGELLASARTVIEDLAITDEEGTNPGVVVAPGAPASIPDTVRTFAETAVRGHHRIDDATALIDRLEYASAAWGLGRGRIGALAAIGAWAAHDDWTYERIAYREPGRWGTPRSVDDDSVFDATRNEPAVWDTVDRSAGTVVAAPHTPGPVLYGIRGDDPGTVEAVAAEIESEPVDRAVTFVTNQGTDAHVRDAAIDDVVDGHAYQIPGTVVEPPETRAGGHVFLTIAGEPEGSDASQPESGDPDRTGTPLECVAFEPTKRFRDRVRALRVGDEVTVVGELSQGTLKLEKFAVRALEQTELTTPTCPDCGRTMESAGADQGYRCRDCGTAREGPARRRLDRDLERGWYEVPPLARRHVAKPLARGGFDAPTHPER